MGDPTAERFRERARECRDLAARSGSEEWRQALMALADDLENEADAIDAEGGV